MENILLMTDSACDLSPEEEARYGIRVLNLPITVDGKPCIDRVDVTPDQMYGILNTCTELPTTAHLNMLDFLDAFETRPERYNAQREHIWAYEQEGRALVVAPPEPVEVGHVERDPEKLLSLYIQGRQEAMRLLAQIRDVAA